MANLDDDIKFVDEYWKRSFGKIYERTNENLLALFQKINVEGEDVFTVLSSSDYLFSAIYSGAKSVDTFDINPLTYRYYHLRKWLLQEGMLDAKKLSMEETLEIINKHRKLISQDEEDSISFWKYYLKQNFTDDFLYSSVLFFPYYARRVIYEPNLEELSYKISASGEINFSQMNICNSIGVTKKYDTIFLSNILDYNRKKDGVLEIVSDNLYRLLNDGGRVILSHFPFSGEWESEKEIFASAFTFGEIDSDIRGITYYQYQKKK